MSASSERKPEISFSDFDKVDIRAGTARDASDLIAGTIEHRVSLDDLPDDVRRFVVFHTGLMSLQTLEENYRGYE